MANREVTYSDIEQAITDRDPQLADLVVRFLEQPDPPEDRPEEAESDERFPALGQDAWTLSRLKSTLSPYNMMSKTPSEQKASRVEAWESLLSQKYPPPRLKLGQTLVELYESGDERARASLIDIFRTAKVGFGIWRAMKKVFKLSEERHDAEMFGVLAWRLDSMRQTPFTGEVSGGTITYMRRRAWRYLRFLGSAVPDIYPQFAVQTLRHYPKNYSFYSSWVANQIWNHENLIGQSDAGWMSGPSDKLSDRAFDAAWKRSPEPLLRLLEDAGNDAVCKFAIRSLEADHPEALRKAAPAWLARIGSKPLASVHDFVVGTLTDSPEFHQSKLAGLGLHEMVLGLLLSDSERARKYAVEYARNHAKDISIERLVELASRGQAEVKELAAARLGQKKGKDLGLAVLIRLLAIKQTAALAKEKLEADFAPGDLDKESYIRLATGDRAQRKFVSDWFTQKKSTVPAAFLCALLEDDRCDWQNRRQATAELDGRPGSEIGLDWVKRALLEPNLSHSATKWLRSGKFAGPDLDVEWVKGLVMRQNTRSLALQLLGNPKLVASADIGLSWLIAMARQPDEELNQFAQRYLLEHFAPVDFALDSGSKDLEVGIDRIWSLVSGKKEPESIRVFAATYLKVHHPVIGPTMPESRSLGIEPRLPRDSYTQARTEVLFFDERADVRRFAVAIGKEELVTWADTTLPYRLADTRFREARNLAALALFGIGEPDADAKVVPPKEWLDAARTFALAESPLKPTREIGLTLIRRNYETIGGARRLAWLMESADREVRLFAVRLLWDRHRPLEIPGEWTPKKGEAPPVDAERFDSVEALRQFVRTVMFGLPPGRMERRDSGPDGATPDRPLPASVAKRRLLDVVRDIAIEDRDFAQVVVPVLHEFMHSRALGEWQGCVTALARLRRAHPDLGIDLPRPNDGGR